MKKLLIGLMAMLALPMAMAADFKEGTHYDVIKQTATAKPEVIEFFSYYCPHCFKFEPVAESIKKSLPEGVAFKKNHVSFIGGSMGEEMVRAFAAAEMLEVEPAISHAIFDSIHNKRQNFTSRDDLRSIFVANGVDGKKFDSAANSFVVNGMVSQMEKNTINYKIRGVPALVVNGKYQVNTGSVKSIEELNELVSYLANLKG
ncbi:MULTISPECIES: thiol:disulfide interchange protein DsbA/DsbL [unclassified Agarivorans]|uniref:thiol:disulfide interchange protein DsbA/DsbL n=1 Tax=unclassified Agarivorans TaxID=2636026 RepID=UPI0026E1C5A6|nr:MULTISPECIES: thiol:disulfide interchange protein DsbA/DsbL [unclassified Agarivorans]MDO6685794.1 thiol:disulfide interchange protein DsbA/DsbL [Agarivorans sp. 3_MG-2023]MDO6716091.1 thiol:disulfide interchange protein DsbA/DsbL [Agarivorans sp. 2_MG-2023]MDO6764257.1 thiol:disulfide interchange protein DsbA/DsbL [Agarivorans sp. 1_MG-2023]